jgi:hypothetical protein
MKTITYNGDIVSKPADFHHSPQIKHSIVPAQPVPYNLWGEIIRAQLLGKEVEDIVLVKKSNLLIK